MLFLTVMPDIPPHAKELICRAACNGARGSDSRNGHLSPPHCQAAQAVGCRRCCLRSDRGFAPANPTRQRSLCERMEAEIHIGEIADVAEVVIEYWDRLIPRCVRILRRIQLELRGSCSWIRGPRTAFNLTA
jgi:hypothetical protein